jgi:plasmid maintenance system killer protein
MIRTFKDKKTEAVFNGERPKGFPADLVKVARRKQVVREEGCSGGLRLW